MFCTTLNVAREFRNKKPKELLFKNTEVNPLKKTIDKFYLCKLYLAEIVLTIPVTIRKGKNINLIFYSHNFYCASKGFMKAKPP